MKFKNFLFILFFFISPFSFAQKKSKQKAPPGTVQINDTLFVDKFEINNVGWREYLYYLEKNDSIAVEKALPDTLVWNSDSMYNPLSEYYFVYPGFNNYPVVGISYEQAVEFCKWRSNMVNELYSELPEEKRPFKKIIYRLLTKKEWEFLASGSLPVEKFPFGYDSIYKRWRGKYFKSFNAKYPNDKPTDPHSSDIKYYTAPVSSFFPNSLYIYNMIGNVAEMVSEKGIAKGGSFEDKLEDCKIVNDQYYTKPERWLGFRCVAIVTK